MRVLHVIPSISRESGGPSQAIIPMCRALAEQGIEVQIATTNHGLTGAHPGHANGMNHEGANEGSVGSIDRNGIPTAVFPMQFGESFKYSRPFKVWLDEHVSEFDVVHVHAIFNHASIAAAKACRKRRVPYIVRPLGTLDPWSMNQKPWRKKLFWEAMGKQMLSASAAVHYTAEAERSAVEGSLGLNHGTVIPLGVEDSLLQVNNNRESRRESLSIDHHPYILVLSRLHQKKNLDVLIRAFLELVSRQEYSQWRLVIAGDGESDYRSLLEKLVSQSGGQEIVSFVGWLDGDAKTNALRGASLLALPSSQENFGLCVMEALACGVPVLISPQVNVAATVEAAHAGWIADIDQNALRTTLAEAMNSEDERERRGRAGRNLAQQFTWEAIARQLADLYEAVLAESDSGNTREANHQGTC